MTASIIMHPRPAPGRVVQPKGRRAPDLGKVAFLDVRRQQKTREAEQASIERASRIPLPVAEECTAHGWRQAGHHGLPELEKAVVEAALGLLKARLRTTHVIDSPETFMDYLRLQLAGEDRELFAVAFLDAQHHMIAFEVMFFGTLTQTSVYPREVVRAALAHGAAGVILAHNHPSGSTEPSRADVMLTQTLRSALHLVDVQVLDHLIVTAGGCASMVQKRLI